ncbi:MAG: hypothetical protein H2172_15665 [Opitutus sp.]|nr:hypothetical protein [Opitutus sp.]MCS6246073.1 hypothetical protein [Opitutus sp.]MCS6273711.1 hypothetical protein [Opitutus sp.]MCS6276200.1 hypothetical protein [Opitutus sp.]MCS6301294.1 hypothetical protein [Opitutus sp.]
MFSFNLLWMRWRWSLFVGATIFGLISGGILYPVLWRVLGVGASPPAFSDMEALLAAGEAWVAGHDPYLTPNHFDSFGRPHIYGPAWLLTGLFGFTVAHIAEFGVLLLMVFLGGLAYWFRPHNARMAAGALAVMLAPSILLGLERANNDLFILTLISFAALLSRRDERLSTLGVTLLLASAAWLKIYPLVAGLALLTLPGGFRLAVERLILWGLLTVTGFALYAFDYLRLLKNVPVEQSVFSYDLRYAFWISVGGAGGRGWAWAGALLVAVGFTAMVWRYWRDYWHGLPLTGPWAFFTVSSASIWVGCLLANPSYPYRSVWVLPLLAWVAATGAMRPAACRALIGCLLCFLWLWWIQWQCYHTLVEPHPGKYESLWLFVLGATQNSVLLTTGLVAWLLLGWGWRRLRSLVPPSAVGSASVT